MPDLAALAADKAAAAARLERAIVWAVEHDNLPVAEVARRVGMSRQAVYDLLRRLRKAG